MFLLICIIISAFFNLPSAAAGNAAAQPKSIFILAGQSNMSGRGGVVNDTWDGVVPPQCSPDPMILRLSAAAEWEEAREPLHRDIDVEKTCGVGPGMPFAHLARRRDPGIGVIGLVPCAIGGTNISEWRRGGRLYRQLMARAQAAVHGGGGLIRGLLWYQGESDTTNHEDARLYKRRLLRFFNDLRSDLLSPVLPVIQVALASGSGPYVDVIRKAQLELELELELPNLRCVDARGLQLEPDGLHLSTRAQVRLGHMLADAFLGITAPLPVQSSGANKRCNSFFLDLFFRWIR
ncbi:probable carbohydrate esterase At4g34215 [Salvia miltiorrhiza]|uniref:probable carbohydrate esterase At4g34215 n=1 Tax=Salvia miltiorrhiza TaxID=226208 RepID=UPI0025AC2257|nr:probable carbohydrate esterase At4g34215 [Salvia miltiorrhiza]